MPKTYGKDDIDSKLNELKTLEEISDQNKENIETFLQYLRADSNVSCQRQYKYLYTFKTLLTSNNKTDQPFIDFDLREATKGDMRLAVGKIQSSPYSEWSIRDMKVTLKKFLRTMYEEETERPKRVKKILNAQFMKTGKKIENKRETKALEPEEVMSMVEEADTTRDKLIPLFLFETGARIGEVTTIKLGSIELNQKYADVEVITLKNDKGPRTLTLTRSVGLLQKWLEEHPRQGDPDAPLFTTVSGSNGSKRGSQLSQEYMAKILRGLAEEADVDKRVTPHIMRHSAATHYGMEWSISRMKYWFGWKQSSMAETYCHENEDRMRKAKLAEEGIDEKENGKDATGTKKCGRCGETWPPTQKYCGQCSLALDQETAQEAKELEESVENVAEERVKGLSKEDIAKEVRKLEIQLKNLE